MTRRSKSIFKSVLLVVGLGGGVAFFALRRSASDAPVVYKMTKLDRGSVEQVVTATGSLNAVVTVQVGSQVSGIILKLGADFNSQVQEGQIVAQIDPSRFKVTLQQTEANVKNAQAAATRARVNFNQAKLEYDRAKRLQDQAVVGQAELDTARSKFELTQVELVSTEAQVAQARASVGMARVDLERTTIRAPISGTVLQRAVDVGQTVAASMSAPTLFTIAQDLSRMEVRAAIDEADVGKLREGLDAKFTVDAYPAQEFTATIFQIRSQPNVQQNVVTYDAILRVENPEGKLRPGMTASVRIVAERRENVVRVPNAALRFKPLPDLVQGPAGGAGGAGGGAGPGGPPPGMGGGDPAAMAAFAARRAAGGGGGGGQGRGGGGGGGGGRRGGVDGTRIFTRVYKTAGEKVVAVSFKAGIADDNFTEVVGGSLAAGDEVVIEASGGKIPAAAPRPTQQPMGGGRGPRMF